MYWTKRIKILALIAVLGMGFLFFALLLPPLHYEASFHLSSSGSARFRVEIDTP